jgi:hypothetical protein
MRQISPKFRNGSVMPTSPLPTFTIAGKPSQKKAPHLRLSIEGKILSVYLGFLAMLKSDLPKY